MPSVHFYTLNAERFPEADDILGVACRLTEKAVQHSIKVYIYTKSTAVAKQLDDMLWEFKNASFIPHSLYSPDHPAQTEPVLLGHTLPPDSFDGMIINLSTTALKDIDQFERVNELVGSDEDSLAQGRERYRAYRSLGVEIVTNKI